jgi:thiamine-monophosphate kinase
MDAEFEIIRRLNEIIPSHGRRDARAGILTGIGDDAAVLRHSRKSDWVVSCDASLEGIHFHKEIQPPESIGYKSLVRAASDLAAMGAKARFFLLTLGLPREKTGRWLDRFAAGMSRAAREMGIRLIGGDTSKNDRVEISITVFGEVEAGRAVRRSGARAGDMIFVSGRLGAAQLGLEIVRRGLARRASLKNFIRPHFFPPIRLELGEWLSHHRVPTAMMDLSDGLSTDLARLCAASRVGARISAGRIPKVRVPETLVRRRINALDLALHGGDDYQLLFTASRKSAGLLRRRIAGVPLTCIGEITRSRNILLVRADGTAWSLPARGWNPFKKK